MKIGVFGGTFNPPHNGHVRLAKAAADELKLDKLLVIPSCIPPHKIAAKLADGQERLEMCALRSAATPASRCRRWSLRGAAGATRSRLCGSLKRFTPTASCIS